MVLTDDLIREGWLKTLRIIEAFKRIRRIDFLPPELKNLAHLNEALPIGYGQTISQPLVVAFMLELLQPKEGEKILDVGAGSGWTTALLSWIVSSNNSSGKVIAIEKVPELVDFCKGNIEKYNFIKKGIAKVIYGDGAKGYLKEAPFDKILVSASARECYPAWREQLKIGGRIVVPIYNSIWLFVKKNKEEFEEREYPGFSFVPLITDE